jgi:uncharacterized protein
MRSKSFVLTVMLVLAVALSACGPAAGSQAATRLLNVNGVGQVSLTPDIAYIYIGVHTEASTPSEAVRRNNAQAEAVISALKRSGVAAEDIRTSNFSIWPSQKYDPMTGEVTGTTYMVDNNVYVTVRDLAKLGDLLDAAITAGANSINSIAFDVADKTEALREARAAAVESAKQQADELAAAAGVRLGEIQTISFFDAVPYPVFDGFGRGGGAAAEAASVPIQPGQMTISVTVSLTYEIK